MASCNSNNKQYTLILAPVLCAALAGCGGGGDDSSAAAPSSTDTLTAVVITESNMADVAGTVIMASTANDLGNSSTSLVFGVETHSMPAPTDTLMQLAVEQAKAARSRLAAQDTVVGAQTMDVVACLDGGSATYTSSFQSSAPSSGDTVGATFSNCLEGGVLMNGSLTLTINSFSGDFAPDGAMDIWVGFSNLRVADSLSAFNADGDMRIVATFTSTTGDVSMLANSIAYGIESGGQSAEVTLTNMNVGTAEDLAQVVSHVSEHFAARFPSFSGSGDVSTVAPLVDDLSTFGLDSGTLKVTGGNNSVLYITFQAGGLALLELDADNDGLIDASATRSVSELDPMAALF